MSDSQIKSFRNPIIPGFHPDPSRTALSCREDSELEKSTASKQAIAYAVRVSPVLYPRALSILSRQRGARFQLGAPIHLCDKPENLTPCIRVDGVYYLVTSSFLYTPGIPVYTSKDLIHWTQIGNVITRPGQVSLAKCTIRQGTKNCGGIWAPTIRYHKGTFHVVATCVFPDKEFADHTRWQNYVWSTEDPYALDAWSDGISFYFPGYDTSLFWDEEDGDKLYVQGSLYWRVKEGIAQFQLDLQTGASLSGEPKPIWSGTGRPIPEAPHMYHKDGWYYLLVAEGGTELDHCATIARSRSVWGPFEECPGNPIIHAASPDAYFQTIGHADIFQTGGGQWFAVALATRDGRVNFPMGRETVLIPGQWETGAWPVFQARVETIMRISDELPDVPTRIEENILSNFIFRDSKTIWPHNLLRLRNPELRAYEYVDGVLCLWASSQGDTLDGRFGSPTFVARRQTGIECRTEVEMELPRNEEIVAGVSVYLDFESRIDLVLSRRCGELEAHVRQRAPAAVASSDASMAIVDCGALRVIGFKDRYELFGQRGGAWVLVGTGLARDVSGGFTGVVIGPFVEGPAGSDKVVVKKWRYAEE
ncbi:hypothetical protein CTheo_3293 [Ceratobasidium theobromae]|uniref:Beta-xylosidase C-terminal Concanavalin A-like domain-containing protein n=1 Tax=Ceratobasidium theobromae TaxID=1582974 RepID=A0A5N5QND7_9AGAM|nr:hypothetical protein CTheo_3293 [Ceratobasidium theobromae]